MFNLLIKNGQIIDGTENLGYYAAIGIESDKLRIIRGDVSSVQAKEIIDAKGRVVCPGFIDAHTHCGLLPLANPRHEPKLFQGITTEYIGIDGIAWAPVSSYEDLQKHIRLYTAADGAPPLTQRWLSVAEFLAHFDNKVSCNVIYFIGNNPLRSATVGWEDRRASKEEINQMKALISQGMEEGAYGLSTGLDYPPGSYADTDELVELCKEANKLGGIYHTHVRYTLGDKFLDPYLEALEIARRSGIAVHLTHVYQRLPIRGGHYKLLEMIDGARNEGLDVTFDNQPYNLASGLLILAFPQWARSSGPDAFLERLQSVKERKRMESEVVPPFGTWQEWWLTNFEKPHNKRWEGKSVAEIVEAVGKSVIDTLCDLLIDEDLRISYVVAGFNPATQPIFIQHPAWMLGTDSILLGDYPNPRSYGSFPYILGNTVREERFLTLPEAIRKMTSAAAQRVGLKDRGIIKDGFKADVVIFDPEIVHARATHRQPKQYPVGIDYVIVNGIIVAAHGKHTGALPGRALRRGQD
ncbi:amidohydrolase family protein [Chloroflexota bacterium]